MTPQYLRTEDGAVFELTTQHAELTSWRWVRLEDGRDVLMGPSGLTQLAPLAELRLGAGDLALLQSGSPP